MGGSSWVLYFYLRNFVEKQAGADNQMVGLFLRPEIVRKVEIMGCGSLIFSRADVCLGILKSRA